MQKRLSLLLSVLMILTLFPHAILAKDEVNMIAAYEKYGDIVTTSAGIRATVEIEQKITTNANLTVCIVGGEFILDQDEFVRQCKFENGEPVNARCSALGKSMYSMYFDNSTTHSSLSLPMAYKVKSAEVLLSVFSRPSGIFKEYAGASVGALKTIISPGVITTSAGITSDTNSNTPSSNNIPNNNNTPINNNTSTNSLSNYSYGPSSDSSPETSVNKPSNDNVTNTVNASTTYLSKEEVTAQTVKFTDIDQDSEEAILISNLAEKGIITQEGEQFNIKKELSTNESLSYLAKLLVVNDAAKSKLSDETVKKYLDPEHENFAYLATVGSMLTEDTLKAVSEADYMSRELFAEVLREVTSLEVESQETPFTDVNESVYKEALEYCYNAGLLIGTSANTMSPSDIITNGQMLQVLARLDEKLSVKE